LIPFDRAQPGKFLKKNAENLEKCGKNAENAEKCGKMRENADPPAPSP
jgi:hypothetical protein